MRKRRLLALTLVFAMLTLPVFAQEASVEPQPQEVAPWARDAMSECTALGMWDEAYSYCIQDPVTDEQLAAITEAVGQRLAALELPQSQLQPQPLVVDHTRGGVIRALYQEVAAYALEEVSADPVATLAGLGVVQGDGASVAADRVCTLQEALVMAQRLVLNVYDSRNAGAKGLMWKATGNGNTLYLLGTIHVDRDNIYPLHKTLREAILASELVALEVDFADEEDVARYMELQCYDDGTTLADHVSPELREQVSQVLLGLGLTQAQIDAYRPWVLAATLTQLGISDNYAQGAAVPPDLYVQEKATANGITVAAVESMTFQVEHIFNTLSDAYQEQYLAAGLAAYQAGAGVQTADPAEEDLGQTQVDSIADMMAIWKAGDIPAMEAAYDKEAILADTEDELNSKLFTQRDPNMIAWADAYLKQTGTHTGFMAVGAGHMIGRTGIVQGLKDLGYTVELAYSPAE